MLSLVALLCLWWLNELWFVAVCVGLNWIDETSRLQKEACSALPKYGGKYTIQIGMFLNILSVFLKHILPNVYVSIFRCLKVESQ